MASITAENADVSVRDLTVLYGRIHAQNIILTDQTVVYAAPDNGDIIGLTNISGPHRDYSGELLDILQTEDRVEDEKMKEIGELLNIQVEADSRKYETIVPTHAERMSAANSSTSRWNWLWNPHIDWDELRQAARRHWIRPRRGGH